MFYNSLSIKISVILPTVASILLPHACFVLEIFLENPLSSPMDLPFLYVFPYMSEIPLFLMDLNLTHQICISIASNS